MSKPKIVCIGGGTGQAAVLRGLKEYDCELTAIVIVTDSGRSSGEMRRQFDMVAPGDVRSCLVALSKSPTLTQKLFEHRFANGKYEGMSFGNLLLAALTQITGSFDKAVEEAEKVLNIKGKVLPCTLENTHVCAELEDGRIVEE